MFLESKPCSRLGASLLLTLLVIAQGAVAQEASYELQTRRDLITAERGLAPQVDTATAPLTNLPPDLDAYIAHAMERSPALRASFERWRAAVHGIAKARKLPEPTISYGAFLLNVETRVGPQRHRLSLKQSFPWPTKLTASADAMGANAQAAQRRFEAQALVIKGTVAKAYWKLWQIRKTIRINLELREIALSASETVRARVSLGGASLAEQQRMDLFIARLDDTIATLEVQARTASTRLAAAIGTLPNTKTPTQTDDPQVVLPGETKEAILQSAADHPLLRAYELQAESAESQAESFAAEAFPSLTVGVDWIEVGETAMPDVPDTGQDALIFGLALKIPLWQGVYESNRQAALANAAALRAQKRSVGDRRNADILTALFKVEDSFRRVALFRGTLIPQAESAFRSTLGAYATGRTSVNAVLMAQRELMELQVGLASAQFDHRLGWAELEQKTGRSVRPADRERRPDAQKENP